MYIVCIYIYTVYIYCIYTHVCVKLLLVVLLYKFNWIVCYFIASFKFDEVQLVSVSLSYTEIVLIGIDSVFYKNHSQIPISQSYKNPAISDYPLGTLTKRWTVPSLLMGQPSISTKPFSIAMLN